MPSPRRVCHITTAHPVDDHRILHKECATLAAAGYDVTLIAPHTERDRLEGVEIVPLEMRPRHALRRMATRPLAAFRLARTLDADIYHFHDPEFLPFAVTLARRGTPVIYDAHEDVPRQILTKHWIRPSLRAPVAGAVGKVEARAVARLSAVVCADPLNLPRFQGICKRVRLVANYPNIEDFATPPWEQRERAIAYVGGISRIRGSLDLVDAMAHVEGVLQLAGPVSPSSLLAELGHRPGWGRVEFHGRLARPEVLGLLARARVGALPLHPIPNYVVAQPVKLFEYMAAGIPVVATDVPPWNEIIERHRCGRCVAAGDIPALSAALSDLLADGETARAMGARGRVAAEQHYGWSSQAATLLELYRELLPR